MRKFSIRALVLLVSLITSSIAVARMQCQYCGSTSIGYCDKSPSGRHEHISVSYKYADNSVDPNLEPKINYGKVRVEVGSEAIEHPRGRNVYPIVRKETKNANIASSSVIDDAIDTIREEIRETSHLSWLVLGSLILIGLISGKGWLVLGAALGFTIDKVICPIIDKLF